MDTWWLVIRPVRGWVGAGGRGSDKMYTACETTQGYAGVTVQ